ncbi:MAG: flavin-containing monooxygenase [Steroidobacteraceae bacterium]
MAENPPADLLVVGAGLAGIGAAAGFRQAFPGKRLRILESRARIGGTWDLFRYPGVRSDSDMYTLCYTRRPWTRTQTMVDGASIRDYIEATARESGILDDIDFGQRAVSASWSNARRTWWVETVDALTGATAVVEARFLHLCTGYYDYAAGYQPHFEDQEKFLGRIIHPQHWPQDLELRGQRVVVIGSGATAVTLVPALAREASQVTLLQRSPSWVASQPERDPLARWLFPWLPGRLAWQLVRWKKILEAQLQYSLAKWRPEFIKQQILKMAREALPEGYPVEAHFQASYNPWDQRVCAVPDGDLFAAIAEGKVEMVTDHVERFVKDGILTRSGRHLQADLIVTATGLVIRPLGGMALEVEGEPVRLADTMVYRGALLSGVPNLAYTFGYINASWTLRAELVAALVRRLIRHLDRHDLVWVMPKRDPSVEERPFVDFSPGYIQRALDELPSQGDRFPWRVHQNYLRDWLETRLSPLDHPALTFGR